MVGELYIVAFAMASGFVASGLIASFYQLVTANPARFELQSERMATGVVQVILLMFAGPVILMRNAIRGRLIEGRPIRWLAASSVVAAVWSLCSGIVVLEFAIAIGHSLA